MISTTIRFAARFAALLATAAIVSGCAGIPGPNPRDPLEPFNRQMFEFNDAVDSIVLKPAATAYREGVPPLVRTGVSNFFGNLQDAWAVVNNALQFRFREATESFARFHINSFIGIGGIFDIASEFDIEKHREDFGQTLGRWGVPAGPYIVLPLLGPSTLRDTLAMPVDAQGDLIMRMGHTEERTVLWSLRAVDRRSNLLRVGNVVEQAALDRYSFTRDAHLQRRRAEVFDQRESDNDGAEPKADGESATPAQPAASAPAPASAR